MTNILSTISGYFTKSIFLGTLLPVSVFVISFFILVQPLLPPDLQILLPLAALDPQWKLLAATLITVLLSGVIYSLNIPVIQLYEGYPWIKTWIGRKRKSHYETLYETRAQRIRGTRTLLRTMNSAMDYSARISLVQNELHKISIKSAVPSEWQDTFDEVKGKWDELQQNVFSSFPTAKHLVLPTELGNVIRSFEYYPHREYEMDAVTTWSRLIAKIDPNYAASIDDAKTSFDFMINLSLLSAVSCLMQVAVGLFYFKPFASPEDLWSWLLRLGLTALLMWWFYKQSISRAAAWGQTVKGSFDLYRKDLLTQLGFEVKLTTRQQERTLWDKISLQLLYGDGPKGPQAPDYTAEPTPAFSVQTEPQDIGLRLTRGIEKSLTKRKLTIVLLIENVDQQQRSAQDVIVTDTLEDNVQYQWDSASLNGNEVDIEGTNPYRFAIGGLAHGSFAQLKYTVIRLR